MTRQRLVEMFDRMVISKDATLIPHYYDPDFLLETNGQTQDYRAFVEGHERVYATSISYRVRYDDATWVESADRVACRLWITTQRPDEAAVEIEVVLIATYRGDRIHRLWELTWPDWTRVAALDSYEPKA